MPKYNLALIPLNKSDEVINTANQLSIVADKYRLGTHSLPHVTLYQFEADRGKIDEIWDTVKERWNEKPIELEFNEFSCISFDSNVYWASLMPNMRTELFRMHELIAQALGKPVKPNFDPHMTLLSTKNKNYEKDVELLKNTYKSISDQFALSLGHSDDAGQLTEIIFNFEYKSKLACGL